MDRLANGPDCLRKARHIMCVRHVTSFKMHFRHTHIVSRDEAIENFSEEPPLLLVEPPGNAKIDRNNHALRINEQITRMHVGMEKTVAQRMTQEGLDQRFGDLFEVEP